MQLDEEIEKAFEAGCEYIIENCYYDNMSDYVVCPTLNEIKLALKEYINGNSESNEGTQVLDEGSSSATQ